MVDIPIFPAKGIFLLTYFGFVSRLSDSGMGQYVCPKFILLSRQCLITPLCFVGKRERQKERKKERKKKTKKERKKQRKKETERERARAVLLVPVIEWKETISLRAAMMGNVEGQKESKRPKWSCDRSREMESAVLGLW